MASGWMAQDPTTGQVIENHPMTLDSALPTPMIPGQGAYMRNAATGQIIQTGDPSAFMLNKLRMAPSFMLDPRQQQQQFFANQSGQASKDLYSQLGLDQNPMASNSPLDTGVRTINTDLGPGFRGSRLYRTQAERLLQTPYGLSFGASPAIEHGVGGGGGSGGGIFGALGRNTDILKRLGGSIIGAGLGLATGNPYLAALEAAKGAYSGQAPSGYEVLGATMLGLPKLTGIGVPRAIGAGLPTYLMNQEKQNQLQKMRDRISMMGHYSPPPQTYDQTSQNAGQGQSLEDVLTRPRRYNVLSR